MRRIAESSIFFGEGSEPGHAPPSTVRQACARGIRLYEDKKGGKGLRPETVEWARRIASGEEVSREKILKMRAWHARHSVDRRPNWDNPPTPGYVAWLLWGGDAGKKWSGSVMGREN
jgi:hypothetical protein